MRLLLAGDSNAPRTIAFQRALDRAGLPPATCISYREILQHGGVPRKLVHRDTVVRFDAPSRELAEDETLLGVAPGSLRRGQLIPRHAWFRGFRRALDLAFESCHRAAAFSAHPDDIEAMFDKSACHERLFRDDLPVPIHLGEVGGFEHLRAISSRGVDRLFVKPTFGSSGAGIVAIAMKKDRVKAWTTVEQSDGMLFNTRRLRILDDVRAIAGLIDALSAHDAMHAEQWIPKAALDGKQFDVRVVMIGDWPQRAFIRASKGPITNLHLLNERRSDEALQSVAGYFNALEECQLVRELFPSALAMGIDLAFTSDWKRHVFFEVNAFGDYVTSAGDDGSELYRREIDALRRKWAA